MNCPPRCPDSRINHEPPIDIWTTLTIHAPVPRRRLVGHHRQALAGRSARRHGARCSFHCPVHCRSTGPFHCLSLDLSLPFHFLDFPLPFSRPFHCPSTAFLMPFTGPFHCLPPRTYLLHHLLEAEELCRKLTRPPMERRDRWGPGASSDGIDDRAHGRRELIPRTFFSYFFRRLSHMGLVILLSLQSHGRPRNLFRWLWLAPRHPPPGM